MLARVRLQTFETTWAQNFSRDTPDLTLTWSGSKKSGVFELARVSSMSNSLNQIHLFCAEYWIEKWPPFLLQIYPILSSRYACVRLNILGVQLLLCFFLKILCQFCCRAGFLPAWCVYTHWHRGKQRKGRVRNILKSSKKTQYLMKTLYLPFLKN